MRLNLATVIFLITTSQTSLAWTSWVGVLEDWPVAVEKSSDDKSVAQPDAKEQIATKAEEKYEARVRPLFVRVDQKPWTNAPRTSDPSPIVPLPKAFSWDVCFSGRAEGQLTAMRSPDGVTVPTSGATSTPSPTPTPPYLLREEDRAPWRTRRSNDYSGWLPNPVYKPILLMSSLNTSCKDPEKWKQVGSEKVRGHIKSLLGELSKKLASESPELATYELTEKEAKIYRAWGSPKFGYYIALITRAKPRTMETFYVSPKTEVTYLGRDMMLVDAGDFDGDGASEVLFKRRAEKKDIYTLFSNGKIVAESVWDYPQ